MQKFLGNYYIDYPYNEGEEESLAILVNEVDEEEIGEIHGVYGETNTSSIVLQFNGSCDGG